MAIVNRNALFSKIRRLCGEPDPLQLPDFADPLNPASVGIADYVDSAYLYDFPAQFRSLKLKDKYTFTTQNGVDTYPFNSELYTTVEMPCYCMKREIMLFNDCWSFYGVNYNWQYQTNFAYGDGSSGPYSGFTTGSPILRSVNNNPYQGSTTPPYTPGTRNYGTPNVVATSQGNPPYQASRVQNILITVNVSNGTTLNVTDDGNGGLIGDVATNQAQGQINYATGEISGLYFSQNVPASEAIQIQYNPIQPSIPLSILYFQNQLVLRPVPDRGYTIELTAYRQPSQALTMIADGQGSPELSEWWELLAAMAAKKRYQDKLDMDGVAMMDKMIAEQMSVAETRTYAQLGKRRIGTIYSDQLNHNYGSNGWGFGSGGGL